jgi:hypothetical protein
MAISKKSLLINRIDEYNRVNTAMADEGLMIRIRDAYYQKVTPK